MPRIVDGYYTVYFPKSLIKPAEEMIIALTLIDANVSVILQQLIPSICKCAKGIKKRNKNFRHFTWKIILEEKETKKRKIL